jgi:hypothetical protein
VFWVEINTQKKLFFYISCGPFSIGTEGEIFSKILELDLVPGTTLKKTKGCIHDIK